MLVGHNKNLMVKKPSLTSQLLPIEIEILLRKLLPIENGLKEKLLIPMLTLNGSTTDNNKLMPLLRNSLSPDVKPTNFSSNNSKNTMMPSLLLVFSELNLPEVKLPVKLQSLLKNNKVTPANSNNMNTCLKLTPWKNSSKKVNNHKVLTSQKYNKLLMLLILTTPTQADMKMLNTITPEMNLILNISNPLSTQVTLKVLSTTKLMLCLTDSKRVLKKVLRF